MANVANPGIRGSVGQSGEVTLSNLVKRVKFQVPGSVLSVSKSPYIHTWLSKRLWLADEFFTLILPIFMVIFYPFPIFLVLRSKMI